MNDTTIVREKHSIGLIQIGDLFHVVEIDRDRDQVKSVIPDDCSESGQWFNSFCRSGVEYVSHGRTRRTAENWFNRLVAERQEDIDMIEEEATP